MTHTSKQTQHSKTSWHRTRQGSTEEEQDLREREKLWSEDSRKVDTGAQSITRLRAVICHMEMAGSTLSVRQRLKEKEPERMCGHSFALKTYIRRPPILSSDMHIHLLLSEILVYLQERAWVSQTDHHCHFLGDLWPSTWITIYLLTNGLVSLNIVFVCHS